jgi:hypothetical protein
MYHMVGSTALALESLVAVRAEACAASRWIRLVLLRPCNATRAIAKSHTVTRYET